MEKLIEQGKTDKAVKVIDLAMEKMPVEYYDYYTLLEPYATGYYKTGSMQKARELLIKLIKKYQENLTFYNSLRYSRQNNYHIDIITDIERYRSLLLIMKEEGDISLYNKEKKVFNKYNRMFERYGRDNE